MNKSHGDGNQNNFQKNFPLDFGGPLGTYQRAPFQFSPTRPHWAELVIESPCPSVCLCHRETPTSGGRVDLWSKIAFLILVWDDIIFKQRGG